MGSDEVVLIIFWVRIIVKHSILIASLITVGKDEVMLLIFWVGITSCARLILKILVIIPFIVLDLIKSVPWAWYNGVKHLNKVLITIIKKGNML